MLEQCKSCDNGLLKLIANPQIITINGQTMETPAQYQVWCNNETCEQVITDFDCYCLEWKGEEKQDEKR